MLTHPYELDIIRTIQQIRSPAMDSFFTFFDYFDRAEFVFVLIPLLWLNYGWKTGYRFFYLLMINCFANFAIKQIFLSPRPFHLDESLAVIKVSGLGFPSGAAQTVVLLSMIILTTWKNPLKWVLVPLYISLVTFARVYMGIHFPTDILGGWCVGFVIFGAYYYLRPLIEDQLEKISSFSLFALSLSVPLGLFYLQPHNMIHFCSTAMGLSMGSYWMYRAKWTVNPSQSPSEWIARSLLGVAGTGLFTFAVASRGDNYFLIGLWLSFIAPALVYLYHRQFQTQRLSS